MNTPTTSPATDPIIEIDTEAYGKESLPNSLTPWLYCTVHLITGITELFDINKHTHPLLPENTQPLALHYPINIYDTWQELVEALCEDLRRMQETYTIEQDLLPVEAQL